MSEGASTITVTDNPERNRYEVRQDGELAGFVTYRRSTNRVTLVHTEVDPAYAGKGLASQLARAALNDIRSRGESVIPLCPFIARFIEKHLEYADLVNQHYHGPK